MTLALEVAPTAGAAARRVAALIAKRARAAVNARGSFSCAVSGGATPGEMLVALAGEALPWSLIRIYQVDERIAPRGHPDRNVTLLLELLPEEAHGSVFAMPVDESNPEQAAARYAASLPAHLDLVHLGLGTDGHTASLVPGDPVLEVRNRLVAVTDEYQGYSRMTLTYLALDAAREVVWLVTGDEKRDALARLLDRDPSIPAARVSSESQVVVADADSAPGNKR